MTVYSAPQAAEVLGLDVSRILVLCRQGRLGYSIPRTGRKWIITQNELDVFRAIGPKQAGRPKKPKPRRLLRVEKDGNHLYG